MKKIALLLLSVVLSVCPLFAVTEPAVMISLASPALSLAETGNPGQYEISSFYRDSQMLFALPSEIIASDLSFSSMLSANMIKMGDALLDLLLLYSGSENSEVLSSMGSVTFMLSADVQSGKIVLSVSYDDIELLYRFGSRISNASLDGDVAITASFFENPLFSTYINTGDISIDGDPSYSDKEIELRLEANTPLMASYLLHMGTDMESMRPLVASFIAGTPEASAFGLYTAEDVIDFAAENNALDILDTASFVYVAMSDPSLDEMDIISMIVIPSIYIDGEPAEDIDLEKAMRWAFDFMNLADSL